MGNDKDIGAQAAALPSRTGSWSSGPARLFRTAEAARVLGTTPARVRNIVRAGLCQPAHRGHSLWFAFQDLVLLRTAHGLLQAAVPPRRVRRALTQLARQLPPGRPLSGIRVYADGQHVVARDGRAAWQPDSGQVVFSFEIDELVRRAGAVIPVRPRRQPSAPAAPPTHTSLTWFERAVALEQDGDAAAAADAYRQVLALDPHFADAYVNLGRLMHERGDATEAARLYHRAIAAAPQDSVAHYNLAIALEDQEQLQAARSHYERALTLDPHFADAHFNLARLCERLGRRADALRHFAEYRKLADN